MVGGAGRVARHRIGRFVGLLLPLALGTWPFASFAQLAVTPHAAIDAEHNSNVFDLSSSGAAPVGKNGPAFGDTIIGSRAGIDGTYTLGSAEYLCRGEYRRFQYNDFTSLSHNEYTVTGGLNWKLGSARWTASSTTSTSSGWCSSWIWRHRRTLILETENRIHASANVQISPEWRLENALKDRTLDSPRTDIPGLSLREDSIHEGLRYLGVANLAAGIDAEYLSGTYRHDPTALNPKYHQITVGLAGTYVLSGLTNFNGAIGYTHRSDAAYSGGQSAVTGNLGYKRNLTGKTSIDLEVNRAINSYLTTGGTEIDTSAAVRPRGKLPIEPPSGLAIHTPTASFHSRRTAASARVSIIFKRQMPRRIIWCCIG